MLSCMVDGQSHEIMVGDDQGLAGVIGELNGQAAKNGRFVASMMVNGKSVDVASDSYDSLALKNDSRLEVTTESLVQSAQEILSEGCIYLVELHSFVLQTADAYRAGNDANGRELFMELIRGMEWFVMITSTIEAQLKIDFSVTRCAGRTLRESVDGLNGILMEIIGAQEQRDWVLMTDLLEYELAPQLEIWLEIFTTIKQDRLSVANGESLHS